MFDIEIDEFENIITSIFNENEINIEELEERCKLEKEEKRRKIIRFLIIIFIVDTILFFICETINIFMGIIMFEIILIIPVYCTLTLSKIHKENSRLFREVYGRIHDKILENQLMKYNKLFNTNAQIQEIMGIDRETYNEFPHDRYDDYYSSNLLKYEIVENSYLERANVSTYDSVNHEHKYEGKLDNFCGIYVKISTTRVKNGNIYIRSKNMPLIEKMEWNRGLTKYFKAYNMSEKKINTTEIKNNYIYYADDNEVVELISDTNILKVMDEYIGKTNDAFEILIRSGNIYIKIYDNFNIRDLKNIISNEFLKEKQCHLDIYIRDLFINAIAKEIIMH